MNQDMIAALRELEREKGIAFETILEGLEEAMASAYKSWWKQQHPELDEETFGVRAKIDPENGDLRVWVQELERIEHEDEEGEITVETKVLTEQEVPVTDEFKGRIGAQTAKQVIFQKLRDAEREMTYEEFAGREGDVVTGIVQQSERRYTLLDLGKVEALLPQAEQVPSEPYRNGERLKGYITEVRKGSKGPQIVVSRTHPGLLKKLFELEVPEIAEGIVEIRAVAREPGHRSKIAVSSNEPAVDPVGACVGPEGLARPQRGDRAPRREDRRGALERGPGDLRRQRAPAGEGSGGARRPRDPDRARDRPRLPALAGDRAGGSERAARGPAHRVADRHQERDAVRGRAARGAPAGGRAGGGGSGGAFALFGAARFAGPDGRSGGRCSRGGRRVGRRLRRSRRGCRDRRRGRLGRDRRRGRLGRTPSEDESAPSTDDPAEETVVVEEAAEEKAEA